ncbi:MAG: sensor histidine kinase [Candidatus Levyibacteriota bacterium]
MFQSARLKLTTWYLLIIMMVSVTFSMAFYQASTQEIQRVINRIRFQQSHRNDYIIPPPSSEGIITLDELQDVKTRLEIALIIVNAIILVLAGGAGYFLAGRTLQPIQAMVDEQNQFISNASHELRTPIATLRAEMEGSLLEKHVSDKEARKLITSNLEELSRLQELSNSLLQLTHVYSNTNNLTSIVSLQEVLQTAGKKVRPHLKKKEMTLALPTVKEQVIGDRNALTEVFVNLFDNAIKYSHEKTAINVSTAVKQYMISIDVSDKGIGISVEDLPHIFERFYRADKSRSKAEGYGLGLSIVHNIVRIHHGALTVKSKEGKGTTFTVTLPLATT